MSDRLGCAESGGLWVFAYGSLIWKPGFAFEEAVPARLTGLQRALCVYSTYYRGTELRPGLVFGLMRGGQCEGVAYRVAAANRAATLAYLNRREMVTGVYRAQYRALHLLDGSQRSPRALCYVAEPGHPQFAGRLPLRAQAMLVAASSGIGGRNLDYVVNTLWHLRKLGVRDRHLERITALLCLRRNAHPPRGDAVRTMTIRPAIQYPCRLAPRLPRLRTLTAHYRQRLSL